MLQNLMTVQDERCYAGLTGEHSGLSNSLAGKLSMKVKTIYIYALTNLKKQHILSTILLAFTTNST